MKKFLTMLIGFGAYRIRPVRKVIYDTRKDEYRAEVCHAVEQRFFWGLWVEWHSNRDLRIAQSYMAALLEL